MLMASQQGVGQNADGVAAGHWAECLWHRSRALARMLMASQQGVARMLMASQQGVGQNADGVAAGCWPEC